VLFDLDGTLIDSVYQHVLAWREALTAFGIELSVWKIHRRIGMSGGLFVTGSRPGILDPPRRHHQLGALGRVDGRLRAPITDHELVQPLLPRSDRRVALPDGRRDRPATAAPRADGSWCYNRSLVVI
jgi:hypothetical protein